jgi:hypothetical protein
MQMKSVILGLACVAGLGLSSVERLWAQATNVVCTGCVGSTDIADGGVATVDLANGAVTSAKVQDNSIGAADIGTNAVGNAELQDFIQLQGLALSGGTGTATQSLAGNGFVKAWARLNRNGTILSCYRCNTNVLETRKLFVGTYEVDFTPLGVDIRSRPRTATLDFHLSEDNVIYQPGAPRGEIGLAGVFGDQSSVYVQTFTSGGILADKDFTIVIY